MKPAVAFLLLLGVLRHYGYKLAPSEFHPQVWNAIASIVIVIFLLAVASKETLPIVIWWTAEEAQASLCSIGWMIRPWEIPPGEDQCSALLGFDLSSVGLLAVSTILACQYVKSYRSQKKEEQT